MRRPARPRRWPPSAAAPGAAALPAAAVALLAGLAEASGSGLTSCPCINPYTYESLQGSGGIGQYASGNQLVYTPAGSSESYIYPPSYGNGCAAHDDTLPPTCSTPYKPAWCSAEWCYVDPESCDGAKAVKTKYFPLVKNLYFSYATCEGSGTSSGGSTWSEEELEITRRLYDLAEGYARGARVLIETSYLSHNASEVCQLSVDRDMCPCNSCYKSLVWASQVDFSEVGMLMSDQGTPEQRSNAVCMSEQVSSNYKAVAATESDDDFTRVGYLYFAEQATGSYTQWPKEDACSWSTPEHTYDPRYRDWYAAGATGPKDVVIVVDVSGSMVKNGRHEMAKAATEQILDTLTWKDFVNIVLFNNHASTIYSRNLVPVTEQNRAALKAWANRQIWQMGGTNFRAAMSKALQTIRDSVADGTTSMCQKAIMFLTDGEAEFGEDDFAMVKEEAIQYDVVVFSYALGDDAEREVTKRLACENRGVFYPVSDGDNLKRIMSEYYNYFVQGQQICTTGFVRYTAVQGHTLYGACMPMYDRTKASHALLGVSCLDVNLIADVDEMAKQSGWEFFKCQASDNTKMCRPLDLTECHRQRIRLAYSNESVCLSSDWPSAPYLNFPTTAQAVTEDMECACQDQSCQDEPDFIDELNYFCDTWIGDDCVNPNPVWGYSQKGLSEVRKNCKRSCGLCEWRNPCPRATAEECPVNPVLPECRACLGKVSGVDIEGMPMACPADAPRNLMSTTTQTTSCERPDCVALSRANANSGRRGLLHGGLAMAILAVLVASWAAVPATPGAE